VAQTNKLALYLDSGHQQDI